MDEPYLLKNFVQLKQRSLRDRRTKVFPRLRDYVSHQLLEDRKSTVKQLSNEGHMQMMLIPQDNAKIHLPKSRNGKGNVTREVTTPIPE